MFESYDRPYLIDQVIFDLLPDLLTDLWSYILCEMLGGYGRSKSFSGSGRLKWKNHT